MKATLRSLVAPEGPADISGLHSIDSLDFDMFDLFDRSIRSIQLYLSKSKTPPEGKQLARNPIFKNARYIYQTKSGKPVGEEPYV